MRGLLPSTKTMIGFHGKQSSSFLEGNITTLISIVAVLIISYVIIVPIILGVVGGLLLLLIVCLFATRRRLKNALFGEPKEGHDKLEDSQIRYDQPLAVSAKPACSSEQPTSKGQDLGTIPSLSNDFRVFEMEALVAATENFHDNNKLGQGGFGAVYKGTTSQGSEIAVKKLSINSRQGKEEFQNEVKLVAKVQHRNLVKLLGCCAEGSEKLIVYEYLPNNSLDKILFDANKRGHLDWQKRYNIILGVTRGLMYLHEDSHLRIIHRDIKASNILLDMKFNPKIADFGIARLIDEDKSHISTKLAAGTRGYMAPEYVMEGKLSVKADVYSFGILLLELISGRKSIDFNLEDDMQILSEWVRGLNEGGNLVSMIDPVIIETCSDKGKQALRCIRVGLLCTQAKDSLRPSMSRINLMLSTGPTKPDFVNDTESTPISGASQAYAQNDPLSTLSSFVSPASAHTPIAGPSRNSATRSNAVASTTVQSTRGLEKLRFWKAKFWRALWTSKREKSGYLVHGQISFTLEALLTATQNFHDDNKLGEGGFGPVYKGINADGLQIAVKKLSLTSKQGKREFLNEVELVAKVRHRNLLNLLGCCAEGSQRLLVYKYLPNRSLDKILFDPNKRIQLDWKKRYNIILGIARGLLYLHEDSPVRIIHRDIKASNILLDEKLNPKISDFGLARLFPEYEDETHVSTKAAGTYGYMAPEYALHGQLTVKADVYSFGVLLLELVAGRKNTDYNLSAEMPMLLGWAWRLYEGGNCVQMIDRAIIETCDEEQALRCIHADSSQVTMMLSTDSVITCDKQQALRCDKQQALRCIHVGLLCLQDDSSLRPTMSTVTMMLSTDSVITLPDPVKPAFVNESFVTQNTQSTVVSSLSSYLV